MRWKFEEKQAENLYLMNFYLYTPFQYPVIYSFENGNNKKKHEIHIVLHVFAAFDNQ